MPDNPESPPPSSKDIYLAQLMKEGKITQPETRHLKGLINGLEMVKMGFRQATISQAGQVENPRLRSAIQHTESGQQSEISDIRDRNQTFVKAGLAALMLAGINMGQSGVNKERALQLQEHALNYVILFPEDVIHNIAVSP